MDLNGQVAIRAAVEGGSATELQLHRSKVEGAAVQLVTNRHYLARAAQLGFTEIQVTRADLPLVAREPKRLYVWMPLGKSKPIPAQADCLSIPSTVQPNAQPAPTIPKKRTPTMPPPPTNGHHEPAATETGADRQDRSATLVELITEAEQLRTILLDASTHLMRLLTGLKQHRRQSRALQTAMQTLRQINLDP